MRSAGGTWSGEAGSVTRATKSTMACFDGPSFHDGRDGAGAASETWLSSAEVAMAKWWATDLQQRVIDGCLQLHGGYGLMHEYPVERFFRDTKLGMIGGGTSEIQKTIIARMLTQELPPEGPA